MPCHVMCYRYVAYIMLDETSGAAEETRSAVEIVFSGVVSHSIIVMGHINVLILAKPE